MTREQYLAILADEAEQDIPYDPEPIGRYNVAPGTKVLLLSERDEQLHLDPVVWSYALDGGYGTLISKLRPLAGCSNHSGSMAERSALPMAGLNGRRKATKKQPYFIHRADGQSIFIAAIGSTTFKKGGRDSFRGCCASTDVYLACSYTYRGKYKRPTLEINRTNRYLI
jgi:putative SOS response-associated peptidase YedK